MRYKEIINETQNYILYINDKPSVKYSNINDAKRDKDIISRKYPTDRVEIKQRVCRLETIPTTLAEALSSRNAQ